MYWRKVKITLSKTAEAVDVNGKHELCENY